MKTVKIRENQEVLDEVNDVTDISLGHISMVDHIGKAVIAARDSHRNLFKPLISAKLNKKGDMIITIPKGTF